MEINILLNKQYIYKEIKREIKKYFEKNENEKTTYKNLWDTTKTILIGKFIAVNTYTLKKSQIRFSF